MNISLQNKADKKCPAYNKMSSSQPWSDTWRVSPQTKGDQQIVFDPLDILFKFGWRFLGPKINIVSLQPRL